jgi:O-antigen ligase
MALVAGVIFDSHGRKLLAGVFLLALTVQTGYGCLQSSGYDFYQWNYAKPVFGTLGSTVAYSVFIGCLLPLAICCLYVTKRLYLKVPLFFLVLISNYLLLETGSRTPAVFSAVVQVLLLSYFFFRRSQFKPASSAITLFVSVFCLYGLAFLEPAEKETLVYKFSATEVHRGWSTRTLLWQEAVAAWKEHPFLGYGPETFSIAQRAYHSVDMNQYDRWHSSWTKAHNHLIQYLVSLGAVGLMMHLLLFGYVTRSVIHLMKIREPTGENILQLGFGCGFIFLFLANLTGFNFITTEFFYFLFPVIVATGPNHSALLADFSKINKAFTVLLLALEALFFLLAFKFFNHFRGDILYQLSYNALNAEKNIQLASVLADEAINANDLEPAYYCHRAQIETQMLLDGRNITSEVRGLILEALNKDSDACKERAINRDHYFLQTGNQYAQLYSHGIIPEAERSLENYETLMTLAPNVPLAYYRSALVYLKAGNTVAFEENLEKVLQLKSNYLPAYLELFQFYYQSQNTDKRNQLLERFSKLLQKPTELPELCMTMAELAKRNNDQNTAQVFMKKYEEFTEVR